MGNKNLNVAKNVKDDEFYTLYKDVENELEHYSDYFRNKVIYCNCDDPNYSNFYKYFMNNFERLGLKHVIATSLSGGAIDGKKIELSNGSFDSPECLNYLRQSDVVVTNPPFSLFRKFIDLLMRYNKKFLVLGSSQALTYKDVFKLILDGKMWLGTPITSLKFITPSEEYKAVPVRWFTNLEHPQRYSQPLPLTKHYDPRYYPKYDDYDAIHVETLKDIPTDYDGVMGVPTTILDHYNPNQFEIIGIDRYVDDNPHYGRRFHLNGREKYARILIKHKGLRGYKTVSPRCVNRKKISRSNEFIPSIDFRKMI